MHLSHLHLRAFRNFADQPFDFGPAFNVLVGDNAQGKTNVIEAIALLSSGRSFRTNEWRDLIMNGGDAAHITATVVHAAGHDGLEAVLAEPRKRFLKNGKQAGHSMHAVLFAPEEIQLLRTQPAARRRYMDSFIGALIPGHHRQVRDYEKVVSQRNRILNDDAMPCARKTRLLEPWDEQLVFLGARLTLARQTWAARINAALPGKYAAIADGDGPAVFSYEPHVGAHAAAGGAEETAATMRMMLENSSRDEQIRRTSLVGPHRDDFIAQLDSGSVKRFASQGQHRSFILALKATQAMIFKEETGEEPIILLDDVASELDPGRNRRFFEYVQAVEGQVFITATRMADVRIDGGGAARCIAITRGRAMPLASGSPPS